MIAFALGLLGGSFLGLLGGGGTVIAVPILVYLLGMSTKSAIATGLAVVAAASAVGAFVQYRESRINLPIALVFGVAGGLTSIGGAFIARYLADSTQMLLLALVMLVSAGVMMMRKPVVERVQKTSMFLALSIASLVGLLTGVVGVGGGFLLVPALTLFMGLSTQEAIATSLAIVAANSTVAALAYVDYIPRDVSILAFALGMTVACAMMGRIVKQLNESVLRRVFSAVLLLLACFIVFGQVS